MHVTVIAMKSNLTDVETHGELIEALGGIPALSFEASIHPCNTVGDALRTVRVSHTPAFSHEL